MLTANKRFLVGYSTLTTLGIGALVFLVYSGICLSLAQEPVKPATPPKGILVLSEVEQLKLDKLQLRAQQINAEHRAADALFQASQYKLLNEERDYVDQVAGKHAGTKATFDFGQIIWIQHPEPEEKRSVEGTK